MMLKNCLWLMLSIVPLTATATNTDGASSTAEIKVTKNGTNPTTAVPNTHFSHQAHVTRLFNSGEPLTANGAMVYFEPGARSAWHTHPVGQVLIVTDGSGWVQQWGQPAQPINPGDVITIPANTKHWHGASETNNMAHLAIQEPADGKAVYWMEKVTNEIYSSAHKQ